MKNCSTCKFDGACAVMFSSKSDEKPKQKIVHGPFNEWVVCEAGEYSHTKERKWNYIRVAEQT